MICPNYNICKTSRNDDGTSMLLLRNGKDCKGAEVRDCSASPEHKIRRIEFECGYEAEFERCKTCQKLKEIHYGYCHTCMQCVDCCQRLRIRNVRNGGEYDCES